MSNTLKRMAGTVIAATVCSMMTMTSWALTKITNVNLKIEDSFLVGEDYDVSQIDIEPRINNCYVTDIEILNDDNWWSEDSIPHLRVTLSAEDGYYFSLSKDDIKLSKGTVEKGSRTDSYTYEMEIKLESMANRIGEIDLAEWNGQAAVWTAVPNAGTYELRLYRDNKSVGNIYTATKNAYAFDAAMRKEGTYRYKVRAVNGADPTRKSEWLECEGTVYVSEEQATINRLTYPTGGSNVPTDPEGLQTAGEWKQDDVGRWYRNPDGSYTVKDWQQIDGKWYYFDEVGYLKTGWIEWQAKNYYCDPKTGEMLANTVVPGTERQVGPDGAEIVVAH